MHLPYAYRSLPRPSSQLKPSHPHNSVILCIIVENVLDIFIIFSNTQKLLYLTSLFVSRLIQTPFFTRKLNFLAAHSMDPPGFEPGAPALQGRCYTELSHRPIINTTPQLLAGGIDIVKPLPFINVQSM